MSAADNTTGRMAVPLSPQDISRIFRRTHGGSLRASDWEFADQLQRDCLLRVGVSTLRDEFAGMAMQAIVTAFAGSLDEPESAAPVASAAYLMADAMLKERAKTMGEGA